MTKRVFWLNPYQREFSATVTVAESNVVILDQTCFYPQGGGQVGDTGQIQGIKVVDTQKDSTGNIIHLLEKPADLVLGQVVTGSIDWDRRYRIMKLHTASHVMEYFLLDLYPSLKPLGSHVNEKHDESTYRTEEELGKEGIEALNAKVNAFLAKNQEILMYSSTENPEFRYWECGGIRMPCGGTHPRNTSEVGRIQIRYKARGTDKVRIYTEFALG